MDRTAALRLIKLTHTVVWVGFVSCILGTFYFAWQERFRAAWLLIGIVAGEVIVLVVNGLKCPLTPIASRYTEDRSPNFDIYLPRWLARYNKEIFGTLYLLACLYTAYRWAA